MSWEYVCPKCEAMLNPDRSIILEMRRGEVDCLIGLHPQPGKYEIYLPPEVYTEDGQRWDFYCPKCKESLAVANDPDLCQLDLIVDGGPLHIRFSRIAGEHATFIMHEDTVRKRFGKDAAKYTKRSQQAGA